METIKAFIPSAADVKATYVDNKMAMTSLVLILAASFATMITSSYTANHIAASSCGKTDAYALKAHQWATTTAVLGAVLSAGAAVGCVYLLYKHMKKA